MLATTKTASNTTNPQTAKSAANTVAPATQISSGCLPIQFSSPIKFTSTLEAAAKAQTAQITADVKAKGGLIAYTEDQIAQMSAVVQKYSANAEALFVKGANRASVLATDGSTLLTGLDGDVVALTTFFTNAATDIPALAPDLQEVIAVLGFIHDALQGAIIFLGLGSKLSTDASTVASQATAGNAAQTRQSAGQTISDLCTGLTAAMAAGVIPESVDTTKVSATLQKGLQVITAAQQAAQALQQVPNQLQVTRAVQPTSTPVPKPTT